MYYHQAIATKRDNTAVLANIAANWPPVRNVPLNLVGFNPEGQVTMPLAEAYLTPR